MGHWSWYGQSGVSMLHFYDLRNLRSFGGANDPKNLLKKEIIGHIDYATILFAQDCEHEIAIRYSTSCIFRKENYCIAKTKWLPNCKKKAGRKIADHCPSSEKANTNHCCCTDEQTPTIRRNQYPIHPRSAARQLAIRRQSQPG